MTEKVNKWFGYFSSNITLETKKRMLLRTSCVFWIVSLFLITAKVILLDSNYQIDLIVNSITCLMIVFIIILSLKGKEQIAGILLPFILLVSIVVRSFFLFPSGDIELFLLIIGPMSMFYIKQDSLGNIIFIIAFCSSIFLPELLDIDTYFRGHFEYKILFILLFVSARDIDSVNRQAERILNDQKKQAVKDKRLIEMQKKELEELNNFKNKFFVNVSHELRTPITIIDGFSSQIISNKVADPTPMVKKIKQQANSMKEIVDQILDLSKMKLNKFELNLTQTNLSEILQKSHNSFWPLFTEKSIKFELNTPKNIPVIADAVYLERAINNIILNSLKYTEKGKVILSATSHDNMVSICISDTGIGIQESDKEKIFLEFYQADNEINFSGGSGIGLSFSKNILELHGGEVNIQSEYGKGTDLILTIPSNTSFDLEEIEPPTPISNLTATYDLPKITGKKATILIIEDHKEMMHYLNVLLSNNYQVLEAPNGLEAIKRLEKEEIDFIVTDYMMPKMNGGDFIKNIRDKGYTTPVIVLTARTDVDTKLDVLRLGVDDYLYKPFNSEELLIKIENRLTNYRETNQPIKQDKEEKSLLQQSDFISDLSAFVDENCHKNEFNLDTICFHFGLSVSSLFRKIKTETGLNPQGLIKEVRLLKARKLIENKEINVLKELAVRIGIKNMTYFKKIYFERFGIHIKDQILQKKD